MFGFEDGVFVYWLVDGVCGGCSNGYTIRCRNRNRMRRSRYNCNWFDSWCWWGVSFNIAGVNSVTSFGSCCCCSSKESISISSSWCSSRVKSTTFPTLLLHSTSASRFVPHPVVVQFHSHRYHKQNRSTTSQGLVPGGYSTSHPLTIRFSSRALVKRLRVFWCGDGERNKDVDLGWVKMRQDVKFHKLGHVQIRCQELSKKLSLHHTKPAKTPKHRKSCFFFPYIMYIYVFTSKHTTTNKLLQREFRYPHINPSHYICPSRTQSP